MKFSVNRIFASAEFAVVILVVNLTLSDVCPVFGQQPKEITNSIGMKLVLIRKGTFEMGSSEEGSKENQPRQVVTIVSDYGCDRLFGLSCCHSQK